MHKGLLIAAAIAAMSISSSTSSAVQSQERGGGSADRAMQGRRLSATPTQEREDRSGRPDERKAQPNQRREAREMEHRGGGRQFGA